MFLHYAFDTWMARSFPRIPFERYADDGICYCKSEEDDVERAHPRARLHAGLQSESAEGDQPDDPAVDPSPSQRQGPAGFGQDVQSVHSRLDQLLRSLLPDAVAFDP